MALSALASDQLALYCGALRILKESRITATEDRLPRRALDDAWDDGAVGFCLEQGLWNFAMRTAQFTFDPGIEPAFGYGRAFAKPDDYVRTSKVNADPYFQQPFTSFEDQRGFWYADIDILFAQFVSDDPSYGGDLSLWPQTFRKYVQWFLAMETSGVITGNSPSEEQKRDLKRALNSARSKDAMNEATQFLPSGTWARSRGGRFGCRDRDGQG